MQLKLIFISLFAGVVVSALADLQYKATQFGFHAAPAFAAAQREEFAGRSFKKAGALKHRRRQCRDRLDNDGDGLTDYPADPGCRHRRDRRERDPRVKDPQPGNPPGQQQVFPSDNPWNTDISLESVDSNSAALIASIGLDTGLHPDFGTVWNGAPIGIPYVVVSGTQQKVPVNFYYAAESDPGPYPIPENPPIEGGPEGVGDRHILIIDRDNWLLYELYDARRSGGTWEAGSGAIFDLKSNALRPAGWTSADAAGLPIFPGLVRYAEAVELGEITHALRFTVRRTRRGYTSPARHFAGSSTDPNLPPMGMRVRLRADFDQGSFPAVVQAILSALKRYGMFVADNGSDWFISGAPDSRWSDEELSELRRVKGRDFEVVQMGEIITN